MSRPLSKSLVLSKKKDCKCRCIKTLENLFPYVGILEYKKTNLFDKK